MKTSCHRLCFLLLFVAIGPTRAAELSALSRDMTYREVKTWHEQFLRGDPSKSERLDAMRSIIGTSRFGERGLRSIYRNFEGNRFIDPLIRGVEQTVLMQRSASNAQAKGYRRELLYATEFHNDPRFSLEQMNRILRRPWGNTDADFIIRHRPTGLRGRVEVKDISLPTQSTSLSKLKVQMDKMALEGRRTGQPQFWINRREVHPDLQNYASKKGILVLGEVKTGRSPTGSEMSAKDAMDAVAKGAAHTHRRRAVVAGAKLAYGAWLLLDSHGAANELQTVLNADTRTAQAWRRLGEQGSYAVAGGGMTLSGGALLWSRYASEEAQGRLFNWSRTGGIVSLAALGAGEAFLISRYAYGDVSSREFWTTQWMLSSTLVGGAAGSWVGGAVGAMWQNPLSIDIAATLGGMAGAWIGQQLGARAADYYYDLKFAKLDEEFGKFVNDRYGVR